MCGITGFISPALAEEPALKACVERMAQQLVHRGPDDAGVWVDPEAGVALGFRRLAILDLSPAGHQPMVSACGRYVIVFNGEVYNFCDLRKELEPRRYRFRGHSDTEVMLVAISEWGLQGAVKKFVGMFAFALWDRQERALHLVRDRLGIKPLYYGWAGKTFLFGSELKALRAHPDFVSEINRNALALHMRYAYIPAPYSVYRGIHKLLPGYTLTIRCRRPGTFAQQVSSSPYWIAEEIAERGIANPFEGSETEASQHLDALLRESVRLRMIADVPLGAFLSGGIDSSTVVALMQAQSSRPVRTFTIGFHEDHYNEAVHAKAVAAHLGTEHTELYVTPDETMAVIPKLPTLFDEPFADSSQIPTYLISALARQQVTVSLSGDGGDELFGGYNRYFVGSAVWNKIRWLPEVVRQVAAWSLRRLSPERWNQLLGRGGSFLPAPFQFSLPGDKIHKLADVLVVSNVRAFYMTLVSLWGRPEEIVLGATEPPTTLDDPSSWGKFRDFCQLMMSLDLVTYLPDDILVKVDRASMGVGLEARVPLLDHSVVEFAARVPMPMKIRNGQGKWLLRQVLYRYVPKGLIERPKMGFGVPIDQWLRGPLREWAEELLNEGRLRREGYFSPEVVRRHWAEHLSGGRNWAYQLWNVLMFQMWRAQWN